MFSSLELYKTLKENKGSFMLQIAACNLNFKKKAFFPEVFSEMFYCNIFLVLLLKGECLGAAIVLFDS